MSNAGPRGPVVLGIDVGSSRIKALLLDGDGQEVATTSSPAPFATSEAGTEASVHSLIDAVARAVAALGEARAGVVAIGLAGVAESGAPLDRGGQPLAPVIAWHDKRGEDVAERLTERFGPQLARSIGQPLRYVSSVAKLGWLVEHGLSGVSRWLGVPELCLWSLTGSHATEHSLAARTGCRDVGQMQWIADVAESASFDVRVFADIFPAGAVMGHVTASAAASFGFPAGIPVTVGGHDHLVGMVGSGATDDDVANSVGTAETVVGRSPTLPDVGAAIDRGAAVTVYPGGHEWAVLASAARPGLVLEEVAARLGRPLRELDQLALGADVLDAPGLAESLRRREPPVLPAGPDGDVWCTLLHELAALTAKATVQVISLVGPKRRMVVFGGGASSEPWVAAKAELAPLDVWRTGTAEAVARGAAIYAGVAAGWWSSPAEAPAPALHPV